MSIVKEKDKRTCSKSPKNLLKPLAKYKKYCYNNYKIIFKEIKYETQRTY